MAVKRETLAGLVCSLVAIFCYSNTLDCGFCFDDDAAVENNKDLWPNQSWSNLLWDDFWGTPMADKDSHKSYRPLCVATFRLNYLLHELQPMGYHLVNVLLHGAVCYLYVQLCGVVFSQVWPALIAGLLFAVHPIHTEAVAGLVGRADVLAAIFYIAALLLYKKAAEATNSTKGWVFFFLSLACCLSSAVCKETGLTAVTLCLFLEVFLLRRMDLSSALKLVRPLLSGKWRQIPDWLLPFSLRLLVLTLFTFIFLLVRVSLNKGPPLFSINNNPAMFESFPWRQLHWAYLCFFNSWLLLCPSPLSAEYSMGTIPLIKSITDIRNLLTLITFLSILILGLLGVTRAGSSAHWRVVTFAVTSLVVPFLPASNLFFPVGFVVAERVLYLPSMGFCMLVAYGCWRLMTLLSTNKRNLINQFVKLSLFYLLAVHSLKTVLRNRVWYSNFELFSSAVAAFPGNGKMIANLGSRFDLRGNRTLSIPLFQRAIELEPHLITGYMNLAYAQREMEMYMEALETYRSAAHLVTRNLEDGDKSIHITPKNIRVYNSLSNMLREHGSDLKGALHYARKAVEWEPDWANTHNTLANALLALEVYQKAKNEFEKAISLNPKMGVAHSNLGDCLLKMGDFTSAEKQFREALVLEPNHTLTKFRLASISIKTSKPSTNLLLEAETLLKDVVAMEPENGNASFSLGLVYHDLGNTTEAERWFLRTLELSPNDAGSLYNLGVMLTAVKRYSEAVVYLSVLLDHDPSHVNGLAQLATCHMQMGHTHKAKEMFEQVLELRPNQTMVLQNYGLLLIHEKDYGSATDVFERLHQLDPNNSAVKQQLENLLKYTNKNKSSKQSSVTTATTRQSSGTTATMKHATGSNAHDSSSRTGR